MKYASNSDINLTIEILKHAIAKTDGTFTGKKITPSINRVIFELEDLRE